MKTKIPEVMKSLQNTSHIPPKNQKKQRHKMNPPPKKKNTFFFKILRIFAECSPWLLKLKSKTILNMKQNPHFDSTVQIVPKPKLNAILNRSTNTLKLLQPTTKL
jgi:hypothetical protein